MKTLKYILEDFLETSRLMSWFYDRDLCGINPKDISPELHVNRGSISLSNDELGIELEMFLDSEGKFKAYEKTYRLEQTKHDCDPITWTYDYTEVDSRDETQYVSSLLGDMDLTILCGLLSLNEKVQKQVAEESCKI
jgi:hypothetical protein